MIMTNIIIKSQCSLFITYLSCLILEFDIDSVDYASFLETI